MTTSPFPSPLERRDAALLGMWAFLATEVLFFGPLLFAYVHGRAFQHEAFAAASRHMHIVLGTLNTAILLTSSLTMALAARSGRKALLAATALLGLAFLGIKGYEYVSEWSTAAAATGGEARFFFLYYATTGLHALHLAIGIALVSGLALRARRATAIELTGLYWHFIDIVWVFLYPMFYLLERYR